ncbi:hypothetical protein NPIL_422601 [Nephila pilipes]|uniref:Uncharacterized protein n=1 Tax=Nephila pilipes TaxID=299642 RepID=A0A8X6UKF3_NEPPI|nr:hypothetical protein NPIL_422601 [Nephila pilipes]
MRTLREDITIRSSLCSSHLKNNEIATPTQNFPFEARQQTMEEEKKSEIAVMRKIKSDAVLAFRSPEEVPRKRLSKVNLLQFAILMASRRAVFAEE